MARSDLSAYRGKRDFTRTPEPTGAQGDDGGSRFVVHKHSASADHYDLRLELDGVLKSWAVPKGPSLNPADKRYAAQTEDHPIAYIDFEGVIPEGEYGGGPMIVWDTGTWAPMNEPIQGLRDGDLKFRLWGEKLKGGWMLVRMKPRKGESDTNWLFFKEKDTAVDTETDILVARPESVKSGLTIEELATYAAKERQRAVRKPAKIAPKSLKGAVRAPMPRAMKPQLATQLDSPPEGEGWLHEIKLDGYRTIAMVEDGKVRLLTRTGIDWTAKYGVLADAFAALPVKQAIIDGEIVVVDEQGVTHFSDLQQALSDHATDRLTFFAFDLMYLDGYDLTKARLDQRRDLLEATLAPVVTASSAIHFSGALAGDGTALYERATEMGLEGIVSKRADAPYSETRSKSWVKVKSPLTGDFPIVGYTRSTAAAGIGAIALGAWVDGELEYRGKCGTGFSSADLVAIHDKLAPLSGEGAARLDGMPRDVIPVRPVIAAHVHFSNLTADNSLRHAVFKGLREPDIRRNDAPVKRKRLISDADLAGIWVTNPTRRLFGKSGPTKLDVAVYYAAVGDFMLPHIFGRPVSLVRSPSGRLDDIFFQRHPFTGMPATIGSFETTGSGESEPRKYISVEDAKGYLALAQFGVIEFHAWGCHWRNALEKPDRVIFDLDPGEGIRFGQIVEAAFFVKEQLEALGLVPYVKTSGGKGLHVVVPLKPKLDWKKTHAATGEIAARIAKAAPESFVVNMAKDKRTKRIFIDFHRNARSATAVAPYSLRAKPNLPASMPLHWDDLRSVSAPEDLNYSTVPGIVAANGDAWAEMDEDAGDLAAAVKRLG